MAEKRSLFNIPAPKLASLLLAFIFFTLQYNSYCFPQPVVSVHNVFEQLRRMPPANRVMAAGEIYKKTFRHVSAAVAMANLDSLNFIAQTLNDKPLQCAVIDMRADYYSVNYGFNKVSSSYYLQAVNFAKENNMPLETGVYLHRIGRYFFNYNDYTHAFQYYLQSQEKFRTIGFDKVPGIYFYLSQVADLYYSIGDYDSAKTSLQEALSYIAQNNRVKINIINTIGLIYREYENFPRALSCFNSALKIAANNKDTVWVGIITGNIGSIYFLEHQYNKAIPYIQADYHTSVTHGEPVNGAYALLRLIKINIDTKNLEEAVRQLNLVEQILNHTGEDVLSARADYYRLKSDLDVQLGHFADAVDYREKFEAAKDSLAKRNDIAAVERIRLRWEIDKHLTQLNKLKADEKIKTVEINASVVVLVLLVVISVLIYNRQRLKSNRDKELLLVEKQILDEELKNAGESLRRFTENLRLKNTVIEKSRVEIDRLSKQSEINADAGHLEKLLRAHIMTDENWGDFKLLFAKVYPGFFVSLNMNYPHLSATDTRMLALIKLGLNNAEMSNMLGVTIEGIKKGKQRLRKKMAIENFQQ